MASTACPTLPTIYVSLKMMANKSGESMSQNRITLQALVQPTTYISMVARYTRCPVSLLAPTRQPVRANPSHQADVSFMKNALRWV